MPLIISEIAIQADGTWAMEIYNQGPGAEDLSEYAFGRAINNGGSGTPISASSSMLNAGEVLTIGHTSIAGLDISSSSFDAIFFADDFDVVYLQSLLTTNELDHFGVNNGTEYGFGTAGVDLTFELPLTRSPEPSRSVDTVPQFTQSGGFAQNTLGVPCFLAGTRISVPGGDRRVDDLSIGDLICASDGRDVPVKWIGVKTAVTRRQKSQIALVRIAAGVLGNDQDLTVTADHGMIVDGYVINASALINGTTIDWVPPCDLPDRFTVYHIETEAHDIILANGALSESFIDVAGRQAFDNYAEYLDLYGVERIIPEMRRHRITTQRLLPAAIKRRLCGSQVRNAPDRVLKIGAGANMV